MDGFGETEAFRDGGHAVRRGDRVIIGIGGRDVPAIAISDVQDDGAILIAHSTSTARVPASAVRPIV